MEKSIEKLSDSLNVAKSIDDNNHNTNKINSKKFKNWFNFKWIHPKKTNLKSKTMSKNKLFNDYEKKILSKNPTTPLFLLPIFNNYQRNINYNFNDNFPTTVSLPSTHSESSKTPTKNSSQSPPSTPNTVFTEPTTSSLSSVTTPSEQTSRSSPDPPTSSIYNDSISTTDKQKIKTQYKCSSNDLYSRHQYRYLEIELINKINRNRLILSKNLKFKQLNKLNKYKNSLYISINILNKKLVVNKLNINSQLDMAVMNQELSQYSNFISNCKISNHLLTFYDELVIEKSNLLRKLSTVKNKIEMLQF